MTASLFPTWLLLALVAASSWAVVNILDKTLVLRRIPSPWARLTIDSVVGLFTCLPLAPFVEASDGQTILLGLLIGVLVYWSSYFYYRSLQSADVSVAAGSFQLVPVFCALWGLIFFGESFGLHVYLGVALVVAGVIMMAIETGSSDFRGPNSRALVRFLLPGAILVSCIYALQKGALKSSTTLEIFFWVRLGLFITASLVFTISKNAAGAVRDTLGTVEGATILRVALVESLNVFGAYLLLSAYSLGALTLVATAAAVQPAIVLIGVMIMIGVGRESQIQDKNVPNVVWLLRVLAVTMQVIGIYYIVRQ